MPIGLVKAPSAFEPDHAWGLITTSPIMWPGLSSPSFELTLVPAQLMKPKLQLVPHLTTFNEVDLMTYGCSFSKYGSIGLMRKRVAFTNKAML